MKVPLFPSLGRRLLRCAGFGGAIMTAAFALTARAADYPASTAAQFTSALAAVQPGDSITLSGTITASAKFSTTRAGTAAAPITIQGDGTAVLSGSTTYGLEILHDYYRLSNFKIQNAAKGLVIDSADHGAADQVHISDITQEAFKVRNQSKYWVFTFCSARRTGLSGDFGEGFYVGQAASNWIGGVPDASSFVTFFNCYTLDTKNDGWDCKEGSHHIKVVNCTADFSGPTEPATSAARGSDGFYFRADNIQVIKSSVKALDNTDAGYRFSNQTVSTIDYGSTGNEIKQSAVIAGNGALIFAESGTNARIYTDCVVGPGGFLASGSAAVTQPAPGGFVEMTWPGEGGGIYGNLDPDVGSPDPLSVVPVQTGAPAFSPAGGTYTSAQNVTITTVTSGAAIRYTTNGTTPTATSGTVYAGPVAIGATATLKAIAYKSGSTDSTVTSATYTINLPISQVAAPTFSPGGGAYTTAQNVTITTTTSGSSIRYTTNGTTPTATSGTVYAGPVAIGATATLKAIAYQSGFTDSTVTSATYTITTGVAGTQDITLTATSDDAKQRASGTVVTNSFRHPLGYDGVEQMEIGLRFPGLNVPRNAIVTAAWIQFEADKTDSGASSLTVRGELSANAATFSTATNSITARPQASATVAWAPTAWIGGDRGAAQKTPDLKTIVQQIVNQGTWNAGNAAVFIIDGTGTRTAEAGESGAAKAPQLHVEWQ